jgi:hypothetical protein
MWLVGLLYSLTTLRLLWLLGMDATHFYWATDERLRRCLSYQGDNIAYINLCHDLSLSSPMQRTALYMWNQCFDAEDPLPYLVVGLVALHLYRWLRRLVDASLYYHYRKTEDAAHRAHIERREAAKRERLTRLEEY